MTKKLSEIEAIIREKFLAMTIDEFYQNSKLEFVKEIFARETGAESDEEINKYLAGRFPETSVDGLRFALNLKIKKLGEERDAQDKASEKSKKKIEKCEKSISGLKEKQSQIPGQEAICKAKLKEVEKELITLNGFKDKIPYTKRIVELEREKERKEKELISYPENNSQLQKQINNLLKETKDAKQDIANREKSISNINEDIVQRNAEVEQLKQKEDSHFKHEYAALEFLFKVLLHSSIGKQKVTKWVKDVGQVETGEVELVSDGDIEVKEVYKFLVSLTQTKRIVPKGWRAILYDILCRPIPEISGFIRYPDGYSENKDSFFQTDESELTAVDTSCLLALKNASRFKEFVRTADHKIVLALSGGISATLIFRERTKSAGNEVSAQIHLYQNFLNYNISWEGERIQNMVGFAEKVLFYQRGYADSIVTINTAGAYYIMTEQYVIEVFFDAAPVLFESITAGHFMPNISGKAKREDELEEEERLRKKKEDDDDYWDRYYNDDD